MVEYPKSLYAAGWADLSAHRIVKDAREEEAARADGFKAMTEFLHSDAPAQTPAVVVDIAMREDVAPTPAAPVIASPEPDTGAPEPERRRPGRPPKAR